MRYPEECLAHKRCSLSACLFNHNLAEVCWGPEPFPWPLGGGPDTKENASLVATEQVGSRKEPWATRPHLSSHCPSLCFCDSAPPPRPLCPLCGLSDTPHPSASQVCGSW